MLPFLVPVLFTFYIQGVLKFKCKCQKVKILYMLKASKIFCPTRRVRISGTWPQPAATLTLTLLRTDVLCQLHKSSFNIYVRENIPVFQSLQELVFTLVRWSLFIIFGPSHVIWWAVPTAAWRFSFLEVTGHCRAKLSRVQIYKYTVAVHSIKNQLMHLLRKLFYIHIKTPKLVKNVL
jgi:hypothetical protein